MIAYEQAEVYLTKRLNTAFNGSEKDVVSVVRQVFFQLVECPGPSFGLVASVTDEGLYVCRRGITVTL